MKNIYYKLFTALMISVCFFSCDTDDGEPFGTPNIPAQGEASAILTFSDVFYGRGGTANFEVTLDASTAARQAFVKGTAASVSTSSALELEGNQSVASGTIAISGAGAEIAFDEFGVFSASVVGVRQGDLVEDDAGDVSFTALGGDTFATTSEMVSVNVYDRVTSVSRTGLNMLYDWANPSVNDIDMEVIDMAFTSIFESSGSGSRYESDVFNNTHPDGSYLVYLTIFTDSPTEDIPCRLFYTAPNGDKTLLEFVLPAGSPSGSRIPVASFTKSDTDTYTNPVLL